MKATITFPTYEQAKAFATQWSRKTLKGYSRSSKQSDGSGAVTLDGITEENKKWIDSTIRIINTINRAIE